MSSGIIFLLVIKYPSPSIIYDINIMLSTLGSGNFKGAFVVSISKAKTVTGFLVTLSSRTFKEAPNSDMFLTLYHLPQRILLSMQTLT